MGSGALYVVSVRHLQKVGADRSDVYVVPLYLHLALGR